jgi:hypothetical protein
MNKILALFIVILLAACTKHDGAKKYAHYEFTSEDKRLIDLVYQKKQLVFANSKNDTLVYSMVIKSTEIVQTHKGSGLPNYALHFDAPLAYSYDYSYIYFNENLDTTNSKRIDFHFTRTPENNDIAIADVFTVYPSKLTASIFFPGFSRTIASPFLEYRAGFTDKSKREIITINNITYNNCIVMINEYVENNASILRLYFDYKFGIIGYETKGGEIWYAVN